MTITDPSTAIVPTGRQPTENRLERLPDAEPPEQISTLAGEYIGLSIAGGLVLGLVVGSLIPRSPGRKLSRGASALATVAGEVALVLAKQAMDRAGETALHARQSAQDGREKWQKATQVAEDAARGLRQSASEVAKKAIDRLTKTIG